MDGTLPAVKPSVSVIVPCYNVEKYLPRAVDSLNRQTLKELLVIWVDDGSPDDTAFLCELALLGEEHSGYVLHRANGGQAAARNGGLILACCGLPSSSYDYVGFMDPDDSLEPEMFATLLEKAIRNKVQCVVCSYIEEWEHTNITKIYTPELPQLGENTPQRVLAAFILGTFGGAYLWNKLFQSSWIETIGGRFPEGVVLSEDSIFFLKCLPYLKTMDIIPMPLYHYIRRPESLCGVVNANFFDYYTRAYRAEEDAIDVIFGKNGKAYRQPSTHHYIKIVSSYLKRWTWASANPIEVVKKVREIVNNDIWKQLDISITSDLPFFECHLLRRGIWLPSSFLLVSQWFPGRIYIAMRVIWRGLHRIFYCIFKQGVMELCTQLSGIYKY